MSTWPETDQERDDFKDWQFEVSNGDTVLGYREWTNHRDQAEEESGPTRHPYAGSATREANCTAALMCPECGWTGRFVVDALVTCTLSDDGTDDYSGCAYGGDNNIGCGACTHVGSVREFTLPDGPLWTPGPDGSQTATVPSPRHEPRVTLTVSADARWSVTDSQTHHNADPVSRTGLADDVEAAKAAALNEWRSRDEFLPV